MTNSVLVFLALAHAIAVVETHDNPNLIGPGGECGRYQISEILLQDYNNYTRLMVTMDMAAEDRWGKLIMQWRLTHYHAKTPEDCARLWNPHGGTNYVQKVVREYDRLLQLQQSRDPKPRRAFEYVLGG